MYGPYFGFVFKIQNVNDTMVGSGQMLLHCLEGKNVQLWWLRLLHPLHDITKFGPPIHYKSASSISGPPPKRPLLPFFLCPSTSTTSNSNDSSNNTNNKKYVKLKIKLKVEELKTIFILVTSKLTRITTYSKP